jgi:hypothetical protein
VAALTAICADKAGAIAEAAAAMAAACSGFAFDISATAAIRAAVSPFDPKALAKTAET